MRLTSPGAKDTMRPIRSSLDRWLHFFLEAIIIVLVAWIAMRIPLPVMDDWLPLKNVAVAGVAVALIGKALYDTLFYDRFWP